MPLPHWIRLKQFNLKGCDSISKSNKTEIVETVGDAPVIDLGFEFVPVEAGRGGGSRGVRMNAEGLKQIIDSVNGILDTFKKKHDGKCPGIDLPTINKHLNMDRKSLAGIQETLNQRGFNYLREKKLWFHSNRNTKNKDGHVWLDRENSRARFEKLEHYAEKSILTNDGKPVTWE